MCNERKGSARCEECHTLLCLPCMNKHHEALMLQFQQLADARNQLKEEIDKAEATSLDENKSSHLMKIDQWEKETISRIRTIATDSRASIQQWAAKSVADARGQLEVITTGMQQQCKEGNYMENDILEVQNQLKRLEDTVGQLSGKVEVKISNDIDWGSLIRVVEVNSVSEELGRLDPYSFSDEVTEDYEPSSHVSMSIPSSASKHESSSSLGIYRYGSWARKEKLPPSRVPAFFLSSSDDELF